ncbi:hypothetical protein LTR28_001465, partial [Elasticomyces elasticus]
CCTSSPRASTPRNARRPTGSSSTGSSQSSAPSPAAAYGSTGSNSPRRSRRARERGSRSAGCTRVTWSRCGTARAPGWRLSVNSSTERRRRGGRMAGRGLRLRGRAWGL